MGKSGKDKRDIYYRLAKEDGYRARSAYKLIQINDTFNVFDGVNRCVDLCSAPGSWSQVLHRFLHSTPGSWSQVLHRFLHSSADTQTKTIISVDIQAMAPMAGVIQIQGDITREDTARQIIDAMDGSTADLVVCDGAPDVTGLHDIDTYIQSELLLTPGSWSQVLHRFLHSSADTQTKTIISVDIQAMAPMAGVIQIQGDITREETARQIIDAMDGSTADLVVCDGAPDVTGLHDIDTYIQSELLLSAINITTHILKIDGTFVAKIFRGKDVSLLWSQLKIFFKEVIITKPKSSRNSSIEAFAVCRHYCPPEGYKPVFFNSYIDQKCDQYFKELNAGSNRHVIPFMSCGDLSAFDSDRSYPLNVSHSSATDSENTSQTQTYTYVSPTQSPIDPPYKVAQSLKKSSNLQKPSIGDKTD
ncbi:unnamed protein product [Medioppia subpectinata]|uniref:Putative tRNA (cytidine(32)/guanosine(34)-2'-O)-methyltransferase n=1 Tax=Medioppia subpectinata TaxID=1979941 RepID=A0A7R9L117_9ACAR|nr:unnamed protein product [Medioppia subpectinata]CAG2113511.1 unnamed protein product [Medioppia subpectinata]